MATSDRIRALVTDNEIVVFMKGVPAAPQCGFSAGVVKVLDAIGRPYVGINVLDDPFLREGIKEYSDWPTLPQVYVRGEFIGGCDIVRDMYAAGELQALLAGQSA
ncbi:MAG: Grx4 family monothiol glutaredoxin [Pseudomonadota bacterium]|uniref:Grx4 family monothiol glutaredoxin n=1 Tax=Novosphingobium sp. MBES04 TaxID=1206458 RepID=UPI0005800309|nr:Grx4 family monothiol glutaredoxin [Novosphingobium sp. MBES04]MED5546829.1 Grx4 family monothiol glutaredoxin [Pseudomonadota bacterium]GAM05302.1 glutaredoxin family protein [Novosphingobium sp. MBES04]